MHNLRNKTRNQRVRNVLDELTCYLGDDSVSRTITTSSYGHNPQELDENKFPNMDEFPTSEDDYTYNQQQDSSHHDSIKRFLFEIPAAELPCPEDERETETPRNIINTPAYVGINFNRSSSISAMFTLMLLTALLCLT